MAAMLTMLGIDSLGACSSAPPTTAPAETPTLPSPPEAPAEPKPPRPPGATPRAIPVAGVRSLSVGDEHACVVDASGKVRCWGNGATFRLGQGRIEASKTPVEVLGLDAVATVEAGGAMTCATRRDASVLCWGGYSPGADDEEEEYHSPMMRLPHAVAYPVAWTRAVSVGWRQATLIDAAGGVSILDTYRGPVPLSEFAPATAVASFGDGFCTLTRGGGAQCVTSYDSGNSGNGGAAGGSGEEPATVLAPLTWDERLRPLFFDENGEAFARPCSKRERDFVRDEQSLRAPERVPPAFCREAMTTATHLDASGQLACAVLADGGLACWGCAGCYDEKPTPLGLPARMTASLPFRIAGIQDATRVAVGGRHICTLHKDGAVRCWGDDFAGQLGPLGQGSSATPTLVPDLGVVVDIDAGDAATCVLREDGTVLCWGHTLGTALPDAPTDEAPGDEAPAEPTVVHERPPPEGLTGAPPRPGLTCRDVDIWAKDQPLSETRYRYDKAGRVSEEQVWRFAPAAMEPISKATYRRDDKGRVTRSDHMQWRESDIHKWSIRYRYDRAGNLISKKARGSVDDSEYTFAWDAKGRLIAANPGWATTLEFDWHERPGSPDSAYAGLTLSESTCEREVHENAGPITLRYGVDDAGRQVYRRFLDPDRGTIDAWTSFDAAGRPVLVREASFNVPFFDDPIDRWETRYTYDATGRLTQTELYELGPEGGDTPRDPARRARADELVRRTLHLDTGCL